MDEVFNYIMAELEEAFRRLEEQVPPPVKKGFKDGFVLQYAEQTAQQAMLQKFARLISGLHSLRLLLVSGFLQEMGVIQRTLDDFEEDIMFVTLGVVGNDMTDHHKQYLEYSLGGGAGRNRSKSRTSPPETHQGLCREAFWRRSVVHDFRRPKGLQGLLRLRSR